jgi:dTMP kinase
VTTPDRDTTDRRRPGGGVLIAFEGGEGAGKSTQVRRLQEWLTGEGLVARTTFEPGATPYGAGIRAILLDRAHTGIAPRAEALLYAADRAEHVARVVRPALDRGAIVITDRYVDSSIAYQGYGRGLDPTTISRMSRWATGELLPDLTILLDLPVEDGLARAQARGQSTGTATDRIESETREFHEKIRRGFLRLVAEDSPRYALVNAAQPPEEVAAAVLAAVRTVLPEETDRGPAAPNRSAEADVPVSAETVPEPDAGQQPGADQPADATAGRTSRISA